MYLTGIMTDELRNFLELNFPKSKSKDFILGVADPKIGASISDGTKISCRSNDFVLELLRGVRLHFERFISDLKVVAFTVWGYPFDVSLDSCRCRHISLLWAYPS